MDNKQTIKIELELSDNEDSLSVDTSHEDIFILSPTDPLLQQNTSQDDFEVLSKLAGKDVEEIANQLNVHQSKHGFKSKLSNISLCDFEEARKSICDSQGESDNSINHQPAGKIWDDKQLKYKSNPILESEVVAHVNSSALTCVPVGCQVGASGRHNVTCNSVDPSEADIKTSLESKQEGIVHACTEVVGGHGEALIEYLPSVLYTPNTDCLNESLSEVSQDEPGEDGVQDVQCLDENTTETQTNIKSFEKETFQLEDKPFKCNNCKLSFTLILDLNDHMRVHTHRRPFQCGKCRMQFTNVEALKSHLQSCGEKIYRCMFCNKTFLQRRYLKAHIATHTGEKPYRCQICKEHFSSRRVLQKHMKIHEMTSICNNFGCPEELLKMPTDIDYENLSPLNVDLVSAMELSDKKLGLKVEQVYAMPPKKTKDVDVRITDTFLKNGDDTFITKTRKGHGIALKEMSNRIAQDMNKNTAHDHEKKNYDDGCSTGIVSKAINGCKVENSKITHIKNAKEHVENISRHSNNGKVENSKLDKNENEWENAEFVNKYEKIKYKDKIEDNYNAAKAYSSSQNVNNQDTKGGNWDQSEDSQYMNSKPVVKSEHSKENLSPLRLKVQTPAVELRQETPLKINHIVPHAQKSLVNKNEKVLSAPNLFEKFGRLNEIALKNYNDKKPNEVTSPTSSILKKNGNLKEFSANNILCTPRNKKSFNPKLFSTPNLFEKFSNLSDVSFSSEESFGSSKAISTPSLFEKFAQTTEISCQPENPYTCRKDLLSALKTYMIEPYSCQFCEKKFALNADLQIHLTEHSSDKTFDVTQGKNGKRKCPVCKKYVTVLHQHMLTHTGEKPYCCNLCSNAYKRRNHLRKHIESVHGVKVDKQKVKNIECKTCNETFHSEFELDAHKTIHNCDKPHKCYVCNQSFTRKSLLENHIEMHHNEILENHIEKDDYGTNVDISYVRERPFECETCHKRFKAKGHLKDHRQIHSDEKPFKCIICLERFRRKSMLISHIAKCESKLVGKVSDINAKPYGCDVCKKYFPTKSNLRIHLKIHSDDKPFECEICGEQFKYQPTFKQHKLKHATEELLKRVQTPFKCKYCDIRFKEKVGLKEHLKTHSGDRPFKCNICGDDFREKFDLNLHKMKHNTKELVRNPLFCQAGVKSSNNYESSKLKESKSPKSVHKCHLCDSQFTTLYDLSKHTRSHSLAIGKKKKKTSIEEHEDRVSKKMDDEDEKCEPKMEETKERQSEIEYIKDVESKNVDEPASEHLTNYHVMNKKENRNFQCEMKEVVQNLGEGKKRKLNSDEQLDASLYEINLDPLKMDHLIDDGKRSIAEHTLCDGESNEKATVNFEHHKMFYESMKKLTNERQNDDSEMFEHLKVKLEESADYHVIYNAKRRKLDYEGARNGQIVYDVDKIKFNCREGPDDSKLDKCRKSEFDNGKMKNHLQYHDEMKGKSSDVDKAIDELTEGMSDKVVHEEPRNVEIPDEKRNCDIIEDPAKKASEIMTGRSYTEVSDKCCMLDDVGITALYGECKAEQHLKKSKTEHDIEKLTDDGKIVDYIKNGILDNKNEAKIYRAETKPTQVDLHLNKEVLKVCVSNYHQESLIDDRNKCSETENQDVSNNEDSQGNGHHFPHSGNDDNDFEMKIMSTSEVSSEDALKKSIQSVNIEKDDKKNPNNDIQQETYEIKPLKLENHMKHSPYCSIDEDNHRNTENVKLVTKVNNRDTNIFTEEAHRNLGMRSVIEIHYENGGMERVEADVIVEPDESIEETDIVKAIDEAKFDDEKWKNVIDLVKKDEIGDTDVKKCYNYIDKNEEGVAQSICNSQIHNLTPKSKDIFANNFENDIQRLQPIFKKENADHIIANSHNSNKNLIYSVNDVKPLLNQSKAEDLNPLEKYINDGFAFICNNSDDKSNIKHPQLARNNSKSDVFCDPDNLEDFTFVEIRPAKEFKNHVNHATHYDDQPHSEYEICSLKFTNDKGLQMQSSLHSTLMNTFSMANSYREQKNDMDEKDSEFGCGTDDETTDVFEDGESFGTDVKNLKVQTPNESTHTEIIGKGKLNQSMFEQAKFKQTSTDNARFPESKIMNNMDSKSSHFRKNSWKKSMIELHLRDNAIEQKYSPNNNSNTADLSYTNRKEIKKARKYSDTDFDAKYFDVDQYLNKTYKNNQNIEKSMNVHLANVYDQKKENWEDANDKKDLVLPSLQQNQQELKILSYESYRSNCNLENSSEALQNSQESIDSNYENCQNIHKLQICKINPYQKFHSELETSISHQFNSQEFEKFMMDPFLSYELENSITKLCLNDNGGNFLQSFKNGDQMQNYISKNCQNENPIEKSRSNLHPSQEWENYINKPYHNNSELEKFVYWACQNNHDRKKQFLSDGHQVSYPVENPLHWAYQNHHGIKESDSQNFQHYYEMEKILYKSYQHKCEWEKYLIQPEESNHLFTKSNHQPEQVDHKVVNFPENPKHYVLLPEISHHKHDGGGMGREEAQRSLQLEENDEMKEFNMAICEKYFALEKKTHQELVNSSDFQNKGEKTNNLNDIDLPEREINHKYRDFTSEDCKMIDTSNERFLENKFVNKVSVDMCSAYETQFANMVQQWVSEVHKKCLDLQDLMSSESRKENMNDISTDNYDDCNAEELLNQVQHHDDYVKSKKQIQNKQEEKSVVNASFSEDDSHSPSHDNDMIKTSIDKALITIFSNDSGIIVDDLPNEINVSYDSLEHVINNVSLEKSTKTTCTKALTNNSEIGYKNNTNEPAWSSSEETKIDKHVFKTSVGDNCLEITDSSSKENPKSEISTNSADDINCVVNVENLGKNKSDELSETANDKNDERGNKNNQNVFDTLDSQNGNDNSQNCNDKSNFEVNRSDDISRNKANYSLGNNQADTTVNKNHNTSLESDYSQEHNISNYFEEFSIDFSLDISKDGFEDNDFDKAKSQSHDTSNISARPFECLHCSKRFKAKAHLSDHLMIHTGEKPYRCNVCQKCFRRKYSVKLHMKRHVKKDEDEFNKWTFMGIKDELTDLQLPGDDTDVPYKCKICYTEFTSEDDLNNHIKSHSDGKVEIDDDVLYNCEICNKQFPTEDHYKMHMEYHSGERPFPCDICFKAFRTAAHLSDHKLIHLKVKPLKCDLCEMRFKRKYYLKIHRLAHAGKYKHQCTYCEKTFLVKRCLNDHVKLHTGEKPHQCTLCDKRFTQRAALRQHMIMHKGERNVKCHICGKGFFTGGHLRVHLLTHSGALPHVCEVCGMQFRVVSLLNQHRKLEHSGEKPHKCETCGKCFALEVRLKHHVKIHRTEKPYLCSQCGAAFVRHKYLRTHMKTHHPHQS